MSMSASKVVYFGQTLVDLTSDTVTPEALQKGKTAHNAKGEIITGTAKTEDEVIASIPMWTGGSY